MNEYFYEIELYWKSGKTGVLSTPGLPEIIEVCSPLITPKEKKEKWTPDQLIGAAVSSCFMNTYLAIAEQNKLELISYHSQCFVKLEDTDGKYVTTEILLRPIIKLTNDLSVPKAFKCIEEAEQQSPLKLALNFSVAIHPKIEYLHETKKIRT